jgi:molecular chaperone DnaK
VAEIVGLDFGTTNSLVSVVSDERVLALTAQDNLPHPSVVWYHGTEVIVGRRAKAQLTEPTLGVVGDVVGSPKRYLGRGESLVVGGVSRHPSEPVAAILTYLRAQAQSLGHDFDSAVVTIPVAMDGRGRRDLRDAAAKAGIGILQFVHEPLAALYGYLRTQENAELLIQELQDQLILVFDWGGGTLDLTLCQLSGRAVSQIVNLGNTGVGGDQFDLRLRNFVVQRHLDEHGIRSDVDVEPNADRVLVARCEGAKIELSGRDATRVYVPNYLRTAGAARNLEVNLSREDLETVTADVVDDGIRTIHDVLERVQRSPEAVGLCLAAGGMVEMPRIRERLIEVFGARRLPRIDHGDRIISAGAAWIAHDQARLTLAKPVELLHADDSYVTVIPAGTILPLENESYEQTLAMYCVDPRDGYAKFHFARPEWPPSLHAGERRVPYANLAVAVDPGAKPLYERLDVQVSIDRDLVAEIRTRSSLFEDEHRKEIYDLEFGMRIP